MTTLAAAWGSHRAALRAALRAEYQINLSAPGVTLLELADLVVWLPAGCALWQSMGGPASISLETEQLRWVIFRLEALAWMQTKDAKDGRNKPSPPQKLLYESEREEIAAKDAAKGSAWQRRNAKRMQQQAGAGG